ncbi:SDR family oxidoreductase [Salinicoccus bachuensis]|uniref:SDR family oxidoreductase n=1 Tax=Salinicoccus bachuensis TaxID=3136731 RepID=A0ABZ3CKB8_9STAP
MDAQIAVITGAGSGLGAALAGRYSEEGSHVCLLGRTRKKLERTAEGLSGSHSIHEVDIASKGNVKEVMDAIGETYGPIDHLVNNAGVGIFRLAEELDGQSVDRMIDTNLKGTIHCTQAVLPTMKQRNSGSIVNIVSASGKVAKEYESVYSASKFGVRGFAEALSEELKSHDVKLFSVYMGNMQTDLWQDDHPAEQDDYMCPEDVAEVIVENLKIRRNLSVSDITILNR